ncbi:MAG: imidazole glycerol phosphate synthase subunit HisH [Bacteroidota bacterium]
MIAIIDYGAGNIRSVKNALRRLGAEPVLTADEAILRAADKVIFPGVGEAATAMHALRGTGLDRVIPELRQPVLGVCLGLQMLCLRSEEAETEGLGVFPVEVRRFPATGKIPHMGWNALRSAEGPLFADLPEQADVYFVHSYYAETAPATAAVTDYLLPFSAALCRDNFYAVQFHPEKSGKVGARIIQNFLEL